MRWKRHGLLAIIIFTLYVIGGMTFYMNVEKWSRVDSLYFISATFTTIGYGDIIPATDTGKIFTIFFSFFGIAMVLYFMSLFGKYFYKKVIKKEIYKGKQDIKQDIKEGKLRVKKNKK